jgi:hypothetical protein
MFILVLHNFGFMNALENSTIIEILKETNICTRISDVLLKVFYYSNAERYTCKGRTLWHSNARK